MEKGIIIATNVPFQGVLKKMCLVSERCRLCLPDPEKEIKQRITLTDEGRVWVSRYIFESFCYESKRTQRKYWKIPKEEANRLLQEVAAYFEAATYFVDIHDIRIACDAGIWELELTNTEGKVYRYNGFVIEDFERDGMNLSLLSIRIRAILGMDDLFVFDDYYDRLHDIRKVTVEYCRTRELNATGDPSAGIEPQVIVWNYPEQLIVDLDEETIEIFMDYSPQKKISHKYEFKGMVEDFAKRFYSQFDTPDLFLTVEGNPDDVIERPNREKNYKITVEYRNGAPRIIEGSFDRKGIPTDFPKLAKFLRDECRTIYGHSEILTQDIYDRPKRRQGEYIVCRVIFKDSLYSYPYTTDDDDIELEDMVIVPRGPDQREIMGKVIEIEYFSKFSYYKETGQPIETVKKIIRPCTTEDNEEDYYDIE